MPLINRRLFLGTSAAGLTAGTLSGCGHAGGGGGKGGLAVGGLRVAQLRNPLGLADPAPTLSWQLSGIRRNIRQVAYRIRVAGTEQGLRAGLADLWDSGKVVSAASTGIAYGGARLSSRQRVWWTVTVWDDQGAEAMADEAAWWEMGLLDPADWQADWLAVETVDDRADREAGMLAVVAPVPAEGKQRYFRLPFEAATDGEMVLTLFSSGFLHDVTLDGKPITLSDHPYMSFGGPPAERFTLPIARGRHVLAAGVTPPRSFIPATEVSVAAQLRLPRPGSGVERIVKGWQTSLTEMPGWRLPGLADKGWEVPALQNPQPHAPWPAGGAQALRHGFDLPAAPRRARLYVAALGAHDMRLNGRPVSDERLQSESTDFRKTILYRTYDVTGLLRAGSNVLAGLVGDGWYASYMAPAGRYPFGPAPRRLLAQLEVEGVDGTVRTVTTGDGWRMAPSPILLSELYNGETYDARLEQPGWDAPGYDDAGWTACWRADRPAGQLLPQVSAPIRVTRTLLPKSVATPRPGRVVVDFGQNFAGLARLSVKGPRGTMVTMRFAEVLGADGTVDQSNLRAARATDRYILRGDPAGEHYLPLFTFHGFRYLEIEGLPGPDWSVEGHVIGSDLPETGMLRIESQTAQQLWLNTLWSQRSNFLAIPTDCPQRDERLGWTGDAQVFWDAAAFNMDVGAFTRRWLRDLRDAQTFKGAYPIFAPIVDAPPGASPGWSDAGIMLPWICWRRYGDTAMVAEHWDSMVRQIDGIIADNPDLIWRVVMGANFGDWLALDAQNPMDETTPKALVATAMLKRSLDQIADLGDAIGKATEAARFRRLAAETTAAFQREFVAADGIVGNGSHTSYILAIRLGLLTDVQKVAAGRLLAADIRRRGTLLSTGFLGTPVSLDALADVGEGALVYDLLLRTEFPSWGYMVARGATTIWERWNGDTGDVAMNSFNHYALGAVVGFLYRRIAGIEELEPGFARFRIAPLVDPRVPSASAEYDSVRGRISVQWHQGGGGALTLEAGVPANSEAEIHLPVPAGKRLVEVGDARLLSMTDGIARLAVGSGRWSFSVA